MNKNIKYLLAGIAAILAIGAASGAYIFYRLRKASCFDGPEKTYLYVYPDDTVETLMTKLQEAGVNTWGWDMLDSRTPFTLHTGRYGLQPGMTITALFRQLKNHQQEAVNLTIPSVRLSIAPKGQPQPMLLDRVMGTMSRNIMADSATLANYFSSSEVLEACQLKRETLPTLFIPNTYQVFWDITPEALLERLQKEYQNFWNAERLEKAKQTGLTPTKVTVLASIVQEETANEKEQPMVAGLYLNRIHQNMLLQADPTVKYAVGDWSLRRVLGIHLQQDSPYNTYRVNGLPPGPLRVPSIAAIDAVLNHAHHNYLYMCAKETFDGTHNFAATYSEHLANARKYINALNARGIK